MSRCYPYPPPGYAGKCSSHEALIFSIKLQKEKDRAISDNGAEKLIAEKSKSSEKRKDREHRKKEKKDKEERRKERKEKKREKTKSSAPVDVAFESKVKLQGCSAELLERSIVTEEHGQPIELQNTSCSSDSTGNSGKRKRVVTSPSGIKSNGNVIRIRLSTSQNGDEPSTSRSKEQGGRPVRHTVSQSHVRTVVKPDSLVKLKDVITSGESLPHTASTSMATLQLVPLVADVSLLKDETTESKHQKEKLSSRDKKMQKRESLFKKLFVDWVAPPLERTLVVEASEDDEEWLFGKKGDDRIAKRLRACEESESLGDDLSCLASAVIQPRAQLLADTGIYALPFTVPF